MLRNQEKQIKGRHNRDISGAPQLATETSKKTVTITIRTTIVATLAIQQK